MPKPHATIIALWSWGASMWRNQDYESVHRRPAATLLVFLAGAARARVVPPNLGRVAPSRTCVDAQIGFPLLSEIPIRPQKPCRHVSDQFFTLFCADRLGAHLRVFVMFVEEHHHRDSASAVLLVIHKLRP